MNWLAIVYIVLFSLNSVCTTLVAAFTGVNWDELNSTSRFVLVTAVIGNWTGAMLALIANTKKTGNPIPDGK